jgi:predicted alpha/beta hydrolase family esterase
VPISVPDTDLQYHLISFDKNGIERQTGDGLSSVALAQMLAAQDSKITDIFFVSHGWKGDVRAAIDQCNLWIGVMARAESDRKAVREKVPGFTSLIVGVHWPSQPWGDEDLPTQPGGLLLGEEEVESSTKHLVDFYADAIASSPAARQAISTVVTAGSEDHGQTELDKEVADAYRVLLREADLWSDDGLCASAPDQDGGWDPNEVFRRERGNATGPGVLGGSGVGNAILSPLRQLSFWAMKKRARVVGETGIAELVAKLQSASARPVRIHLMGHSFGCIVVSAATLKATQKTGRPVDTLILIQGALSLWSYAPRVQKKNEPGYFSNIPANSLVRGAIVATLSDHDKAVGNLYPMAVRLAKQYTLADLPLYGGVGSYGLCGLEHVGPDIVIWEADAAYGFQRGNVYNINATRVIANGDGFSGAHSDIAHPEVAHVAWQAIACSM